MLKTVSSINIEKWLNPKFTSLIILHDPTFKTVLLQNEHILHFGIQNVNLSAMNLLTVTRQGIRQKEHYKSKAKSGWCDDYGLGVTNYIE